MTTIEKTPHTEARPVSGHIIYRRVQRERLAYGAVTLGIAIAPQMDALWPAHAAAAAVAAGTAAWLWNKAQNTDGLGLLTACQRGLPVLTAAGLYLANLLAPGVAWWEIATPAAWGVLMGWMAPITRSAGLTLEIPQQTQAPAIAASPRPSGYVGMLAQRWDVSGIAPGTQLSAVRQYQPDRPDFHAVIVAQQGKAVPTLTPTALAAVFDFPEGTVALSPIDGSGPGRKLLTARPTLMAQEQQDTDPIHRIWNEKIAHQHGGAPGMILADYRLEPNRIALRTSAPDGQLINLNQKLLARALTPQDATLCMVETDGLGEGVISIYKTHPLMQVREATAADLTMAGDGTIQIGVRPDGRAARMPLYDPQMGALTDLIVGAMGAGKSVTLNTVLVAERLSGIVSIVADAQDGMSIPEADGRVYHFGKGVAAVGATLGALNDLGKYRERISAENGWGSFEPGNPWRIANGTFDELNRILSAESTVPRNFRKWVTGLVGDTQSTGRKLGVGIRFAAQSIHLADLGDKDKIRANAKNGSVWLGRTNSSTTQHMATDGVVPPGVTLEPIPRYFKTGTGSSVDAAFHGEEAKNGPITAGMANVIQGGSIFLARTFNARKENKTYPGLIALYESAPIPQLTPEEDQVFRQAYAKWLPYAEALLLGDDEDGEDEDSPYVYDPLAAPPATNTTATIKQRILDLLTGGPMALKDVRARLADVAPGSVNNTMGQLNEDGLVTPLSRGTYQLAGGSSTA
ncbi:MAG: sle2 [Frankiales bacterium]|nr:sle2 [Frankiales bacterium]